MEPGAVRPQVLGGGKEVYAKQWADPESQAGYGKKNSTSTQHHKKNDNNT